MIDLNKMLNKELYMNSVKTARDYALKVTEILQDSSKRNPGEKLDETLDFCNTVIKETELFLENGSITTYLYRPHKGTLTDSMAEKKEFLHESDMFEYIANNSFGLIKKDDLVIDEVSIDDERIGWKNVRMVLTKRMGDDDYMEIYNAPQCVGYFTERKTTFDSFWNRMYEEFVYRR